MSTPRPEYRTSNGTALKRTDAAAAVQRSAPYGWDERVHGTWPPVDEVNYAGALDQLSDTLEQKEAEQSRARLRARFGLDDDNHCEDDSLRRKIFGDSL